MRLEAGPRGTDLLAFADPAAGDLAVLEEPPVPDGLRASAAWQALGVRARRPGHQQRQQLPQKLANVVSHSVHELPNWSKHTRNR